MDNYSGRRERAEKKLQRIKDFHKHVKVYFALNLFLLVIRSDILEFVDPNISKENIDFYNWFDLNMLVTPIIWGVVLLCHYFYVFKKPVRLFKNWEERQIRKYMEKDRDDAKKFI